LKTASQILVQFYRISVGSIRWVKNGLIWPWLWTWENDGRGACLCRLQTQFGHCIS